MDINQIMLNAKALPREVVEAAIRRVQNDSDIRDPLVSYLLNRIEGIKDWAIKSSPDDLLQAKGMYLEASALLQIILPLQQGEEEEEETKE